MNSRILLAQIMCILFLITGCASDNTNPNTSSNVDPNLEIFGKKYEYYNYGSGKVNLDLFKINKDLKVYGLTVDNEQNFVNAATDFLNFYKINIIDVSKIKNIAVYGKTPSLKIGNNISGFSIFINTSQGFEHHLFKIENNIASEMRKFKKIYKYGVLSETIGNLCYNADNSNTFFLTLRNPKQFPNTKKGSTLYADDILLLEQYPMIITYEIGSKHYCKISECGTDKVGFCTAVTDEEASRCVIGSYITDCPDDEVGGAAPVTGSNPKYLSQYKTAMYNVRDNLLSLSPKGKQYVDFYYKLGYVFKVTGVYETDSEYRSDILDIVDFLRLKSELFWNAKDSDILISVNEATKMKTEITKFRKLTTNLEYQSILDTLATDLDNMKGKSKKDVLNYIM